MAKHIIDNLLKKEEEKRLQELRLKRREEIRKRHWYKMYTIRIKLTEQLFIKAERNVNMLFKRSQRLRKILLAKGLENENGLVLSTYNTYGRLGMLWSVCDIVLRKKGDLLALSVKRVYHGRSEPLYSWTTHHPLENMNDSEKYGVSAVFKELTRIPSAIHLLFNAVTKLKKQPS